MEPKMLSSACHDQLVLVLSFFPRVDAKRRFSLPLTQAWLATRLHTLQGLIPCVGGSSLLRLAPLRFSRAAFDISTKGHFPN
jgi:hypothetical protein